MIQFHQVKEKILNYGIHFIQNVVVVGVKMEEYINI